MDNVGLVHLGQLLAQGQVQVVGRLDVQLEHGVEVGQVIVEPQRGVVHDGAQAVVVALQVFDQGQALVFLAQVGLELDDVRVRGLGAFAAAGADHGMAGLRQVQGQRQSDSLAGSGDKNWAVHGGGGQLLLVRLDNPQHTRTRRDCARPEAPGGLGWRSASWPAGGSTAE
ncbi:hypothetical protein D3C80_458020 [compost metagenome]